MILQGNHHHTYVFMNDSPNVRTRIYFISTDVSKKLKPSEYTTRFLTTYFLLQVKLSICNYCCVVSSTLSIHKLTTFLFVFICLNHFSQSWWKIRTLTMSFRWTFHDKYDSQRNSPKAITHMKCEFFRNRHLQQKQELFWSANGSMHEVQ